MNGQLVAQLAQSNNIIPYHPHINAVIGSVTSTILFQQIIYWSSKSGGEFYKYKEPCNAKGYADGDSWCEELSFTRKEFDSALKRIGTKINKDIKKSDILKVTTYDPNKDDLIKTLKHLVIYWTDKSRQTYYELNAELAENILSLSIYMYNEANEQYKLKRQSELNDLKYKRDFTVKYKSDFTIKPESDFIYTETTRDYQNSLHDESCEQPKDKIIPYEDDERIRNSVGARIKQDQLSTVVTPSDNSIPDQDDPNPLDAEAEQIPTKENEAMKELIADAKRKASDNALALSEVIPDLLDLHNRREWNIAHMLSGTSTKTGYKEYAPYFTGDNMVTPDELSKVVAYYRQECEGTHIIQSPEIVSDWVGKYRNSVKANTEQDNTTKRAMMMRASLIPQQEPEEG
jgi:hypothetical protein